MSETFSIGEWVSQRRKALDMTQRELAERASCTVATIKKIESDERRPSRDLAGLLADALQVPQQVRAVFLDCARGLRPVDVLSSTAGDAQPVTPIVNLPAESTPFIGREVELAQITGYLRDPACRLLTLVGPGGIGKTRLAYQAAASTANRFPAGVHAVPLAGVNAPDYLLPAIAERLKLTFFNESDPRTQLLNFLREKTLLLVLDNFEHLLEGAALLADIITAAPGVKILATSRERLNLSGEWVYPVDGLPFPKQSVNGDDLAAYDAVRLFEGSARRALPGYTLGDDLPAASHICRLAEGMPLAIELAASWVRRMPCAQIAEQIRRDLDFLAAGWRDVPERHRSIRALFEHSWRLLAPDEQQVMMTLSVFRGGFDAEAAQTIAGASLPVLAALEDKSLVRASPTGRFDLHELVRQYAESRLTEAGKAAETRNRHLDYFTGWAELADSKLHGGEQILWVRHIQVEYDNLRAALAWAFDGGDSETGLRLANALWYYWFGRGHFLEGYDWMRLGLQQTEGMTPVRAVAFGGAGVIAAQLRQQVAGEYVMQGRHYAEQLGMKESLAMSNTSISFAIQDYEAARALYEECIAVLRETPQHFYLRTALFLYGDRARGHGDLERAEALYRESLALARADQDLWGMTMPLGNLGRLAVHRGDYERGKGLVREAININRELGNRAGIANYLIYLGALAVYLGDYQSAERDLNETLAIWQNQGHEMGIIHALYCLAELALHREDFMGAARLLADSLNTTLRIPDWEVNFSNREFSVDRLVIAGKLACALGDYPQASRLLGAGEAVRAQVGYVLEPLPRAEYEQAVAETRGQMGEAAFQHAWAEGQALNEADAVAEALAYVEKLSEQIS
jgi:predicted ATPase/transcriptional regulator with XRE-family HTH domain